MKTTAQLKKTAEKINATVKENDTLIFLNFSREGSYDKAVKWGTGNGLALSTKEDIEALKDTDLPAFFGKAYGYLVETTGSTFDGNAFACYMWWNDAERESFLNWQYYFGNGYDWFAFRKSSVSQTLIPSGNLDPLPLGLSDAIRAVKEAGYVVYKQI